MKTNNPPTGKIKVNWKDQLSITRWFKEVHYDEHGVSLTLSYALWIADVIKQVFSQAHSEGFKEGVREERIKIRNNIEKMWVEREPEVNILGAAVAYALMKDIGKVLDSISDGGGK